MILAVEFRQETFLCQVKQPLCNFIIIDKTAQIEYMETFYLERVTVLISFFVDYLVQQKVAAN
jgi:hypothetical protein